MRFSIAIVALILIGAGCSSGPKEKTAADEALYHQAAVSLIDTFSTTLKGKLMSSIDESGAAGAIDVCQIEAPKLAAEYSVGGWSIRRVTDRWRNPDNAADSSELAILARFAAPDAPDHYEAWDSSGVIATYRYYQPIRTGPLCLNCHGTQQRLAEGLIEKVRRIYPDDMATGYEDNELRGMFVVRGHWPEGEAKAKMLASHEM